MNQSYIARHWYASVYEQFENHTNDIDFLLSVLGEHDPRAQLNILEVACGGGRMTVPIARAGHKVTGFDADEAMLLRCYARTRGMSGVRCYRADAVKDDWGVGYDLVLIAGNLLINIESDVGYIDAQRILLRKAAGALRAGGHLYLDFNLHYDPNVVFNCLRESSYFTGTDELGTSGRTVSYGSAYDPMTQICAGAGHFDLTTNSGERLIVDQRFYKHIPTQAQVYGWLRESGFVTERTYMNRTQEAIPEPIPKGMYQATIWAMKS